MAEDVPAGRQRLGSARRLARQPGDVDEDGKMDLVLVDAPRGASTSDALALADLLRPDALPVAPDRLAVPSGSMIQP